MDFDNNIIVNNDESEEVNETQEEEIEENEETVIDYSSILEEMNTRLENIETNTSVDYTSALNGILANTYFLDFVGFTVFIFLMLFVVIKFFKIFF